MTTALWRARLCDRPPDTNLPRQDESCADLLDAREVSEPRSLSHPSNQSGSWRDRMGELKSHLETCQKVKTSTNWSRGVTGSTLNSESGGCESIPQGTFCARHCVMSVGGHSQAGPNRSPRHSGWYLKITMSWRTSSARLHMQLPNTGSFLMRLVR